MSRLQDVRLWAMLATPFDQDGSGVDHPSLARYVREVVAHGCDGVAALGIIGEPQALSTQERRDALATIMDATDVPVLVSAMALDPDQRRIEGTALLAALPRPPAGLMVPVDTADPLLLRRYLEQAHAWSGLPLMLQDHPGWSWVSITVDALVEALTGLDCVVALKCEAPPTFARIRQLSRALPQVRCVSGLGGLSLVDDLTQGATAAACGMSRPEVAAEVLDLVAAGRRDEAQRTLNQIAGAIGLELQQGTSIAMRKEALRRRGFIDHSTVRGSAQPYERWMGELLEAHARLAP